MSSDLDFDRGDSCGSFEFLSRGHVRKGGRRPSAPADESIQEETCDDDLEDEEDEEDRLFCPKRPFGDVGSVLPGGKVSRLQKIGFADHSRAWELKWALY